MFQFYPLLRMLMLILLLAAPRSAAAQSWPWEGLWGANNAICVSGKKIGEEEGAPIRITRKSITGLETGCDFQRVDKTGPSDWTVRMKCEGEGETYRQVEVFSLLSPDRLRIRSQDRRVADYQRCAAASGGGFYVHDPSVMMTEAAFNALPSEVVGYVREIRKRCAELIPETRPYAIDQGISFVDIDGDGATDIIVDAETLCGAWIKGGNCSNRGCDLKIWRQSGPNAWVMVFDEHLHAKFLSVDERYRLKLLVASIYAGDRRCKPDPRREYSSGQKCDALVTYQIGRWNWQKIE